MLDQLALKKKGLWKDRLLDYTHGNEEARNVILDHEWASAPRDEPAAVCAPCLQPTSSSLDLREMRTVSPTRDWQQRGEGRSLSKPRPA